MVLIFDKYVFSCASNDSIDPFLWAFNEDTNLTHLKVRPNTHSIQADKLKTQDEKSLLLCLPNSILGRWHKTTNLNRLNYIENWT